MSAALLDWSLPLANFLLDLALALLIGVLANGRSSPLTRPPRLSALLLLAMAGAMAGATQGMADDSLSFWQNLWLMLSATHSGTMLQLGSCGVLLVVLGLRDAARPGARVWLGAALLLYARADSGHAAVLPALSFGLCVHAAHLAAAGVWTGCVLAAACEQRVEPLAAQRLSSLSTGALAVLALSGALNVERMQASHAILKAWSAYDGWLAGKLGLIAAAALLGLYNRWRYLPALAQPQAGMRFLRVLRIEAVLLVLVLFVAARLGSTLPGVAA